VRVVLDTGILISALITRNTPPDLLYRAWRKGLFTLITSAAQLEEIERVLTYKKLERYICRDEAQLLIDGLYRLALMVPRLPTIDFSPDPDDNKIIATAIAGNADYLVSGDKRDLLSLRIVDQIPVVTARQMMEVLKIAD
jgi:putative PIN family toxin of toxin-antitoxin system